MALSLALPLSGLDIRQFRGIHGVLCRSEYQPIERPMSPSARSDSSGISSITTITATVTPSSSPIISRSNTPSDDGHNTKPNNRRRVRYSTPARGSPHCSMADLCGFRYFQRFVDSPSAPQPCQRTIQPIRRPSALQESRQNINQRVVYGNRDILNLEANLRSPFWQMKIPEVPRNNISYFMENRSVYHRLGDYGLIEEYPTIHCRDCDFSEPLPFA